MPYKKRQIIEVYYDFKEKTLLHPAVILSNEDVYTKKEYYICALISLNIFYF